MTTEQDEAKAINKDIHKMQKKRFWDSMKNSKAALLLKGLGMFYFGATSMALSAFGAYQAHFGSYQTWARWLLCLISAPAFVVASTLLGKLFVRAARD